MNLFEHRASQRQGVWALLDRARYYEPSSWGFEKEIARRLAYWDKIRNGHESAHGKPGEESGEPPR